MTKKELCTRVSDYLKEHEIRKPIRVEKNTFRITDGEGKTAEFTVRQHDKTAIYTYDDVSSIVDACLLIIKEALKEGESVYLRGFGTFALHYRAPRRVKDPNDRSLWHEIAGHYLPKFFPGKEMKLSAKVFELKQADQDASPKPPEPVYDEYD